jgi:hypothetical protein
MHDKSQFPAPRLLTCALPTRAISLALSLSPAAPCHLAQAHACPFPTRACPFCIGSMHPPSCGTPLCSRARAAVRGPGSSPVPARVCCFIDMLAQASFAAPTHACMQAMPPADLTTVLCNLLASMRRNQRPPWVKPPCPCACAHELCPGFFSLPCLCR